MREKLCQSLKNFNCFLPTSRLASPLPSCIFLLTPTQVAMADLGGGRRGRSTPWSPWKISFFCFKFGWRKRQIWGLGRKILEIAHWKNFWIRHWRVDWWELMKGCGRHQVQGMWSTPNIGNIPLLYSYWTPNLSMPLHIPSSRTSPTDIIPSWVRPSRSFSTSLMFRVAKQKSKRRWILILKDYWKSKPKRVQLLTKVLFIKSVKRKSRFIKNGVELIGKEQHGVRWRQKPSWQQTSKTL